MGGLFIPNYKSQKTQRNTACIGSEPFLPFQSEHPWTYFSLPEQTFAVCASSFGREVSALHPFQKTSVAYFEDESIQWICWRQIRSLLCLFDQSAQLESCFDSYVDPTLGLHEGSLVLR